MLNLKVNLNLSYLRRVDDFKNDRVRKQTLERRDKVEGLELKINELILKKGIEQKNQKSEFQQKLKRLTGVLNQSLQLEKSKSNKLVFKVHDQKKTINDLKDQLRGMGDSMSKKEELFAVLRKTMLLSKEEFSKFNMDEVELREKLEETTLAHLDKTAVWESQRRGLEEAIENKDQQMAKMQARELQHTKQINELSMQVKTQSIMISSEANMVAELRKGVQKSEARGESQVRESSQLQRELGRLEKENKDLRKKVGKLEKKKKEQDQLIQDYEQELSLRNDDVLNLQKEIDESRAEDSLEELRGSLHFLKKENSRLKGAVAQLKEMLSQFQMVSFYYDEDSF